MYCTQCGREVQDGKKFCVHCGKPLKQAQQASGLPETEAQLKAESAALSGAQAEPPSSDAAAAGGDVPAQAPVPPLPGQGVAGSGTSAPVGSVPAQVPVPPSPGQGVVGGGVAASAEGAPTQAPNPPTAGQEPPAGASPPPLAGPEGAPLQQPPRNKKLWLLASGVLVALAVVVGIALWGSADNATSAKGKGGASESSDTAPADAGIPTDQQQIGVQLHQVDSRSFPEVTVYASLMDALGNPLDAIRAGDVRVYETDENGNHEEMVVAEVFRVVDSGTVSINLVIDRSASMSANDAMWQAKSAAVQFLDNVYFDGGDMVALTSFNDYVYVDEDFTGDAFVLSNSINAMEIKGTTSLHDAIYAALLRTHEQYGSKCVIAFTDGHENASSYRFDDVVALSASTGIPVHIIGVGNDTDEDALRRLAEACGGSYHHADTLGLDAALGEIYAGIYSQQQEWFGIRYTSTLTGGLSSARQVVVDMNPYQGYTGTSPVGHYTPQAVIDGTFAGIYGHVDKEIVYEAIVQYISCITRSQSASGHDRQRLAQLAAAQPQMTDYATALSSSERARLEASFGGIYFEYRITLGDFNLLLEAVYGSNAFRCSASDFATSYAPVRNPGVYTYNGDGWFIVYSAELDCLVLGRPDTADVSRVLNYIVAATQEPGGYTMLQIDILQLIVCRGEYRDNGFFANADGDVYAVLDKYGETEITQSEYEQLLREFDFAALQALLADLIQKYGLTGAACRVDAGTYGDVEDAFLEGVTMESGTGPAGMSEAEALAEAGYVFRAYYESFLVAIEHLDASYIEHCTENQRRRQDARIFEFNKDHTFQNKNLLIDGDTVELVYENGRHTLRFNIRCENDMWRRVAGANREDNVSLQMVEMYYDEAAGRWIVASTVYDNEMSFSSNLISI